MRVVLGVWFLLLTAGPLLADDGPALWEKDVYHVVQIENVADWPDYVFFVFPVGDTDRKESVIRASADGEARFVVTSWRLANGFSLYAAPRRFAPAPENLIDSRDLRDTRPGVLKSTERLAAAPATHVPLTESNDAFVTRYRVERDGPTTIKLVLLEQKMVPRSSLPGEEGVSLSRWWLPGLGLVVLVAGLGVVVWRAKSVMSKK